jgi:hypothetical protein
MRRAGSDPVLGEISLLNHNLAFHAGLLTAADGFKLDAQVSGGIKQVGIAANLALPTGWHQRNMASLVGEILLVTHPF